jgi:hypothetical protein
MNPANQNLPYKSPYTYGDRKYLVCQKENDSITYFAGPYELKTAKRIRTTWENKTRNNIFIECIICTIDGLSEI